MKNSFSIFSSNGILLPREGRSASTDEDSVLDDCGLAPPYAFSTPVGDPPETGLLGLVVATSPRRSTALVATTDPMKLSVVWSEDVCDARFSSEVQIVGFTAGHPGKGHLKGPPSPGPGSRVKGQ